MHSTLPLDNFGGRLNAEQGQIFTAQDVDRIGDYALTSLLNFLALLFWDEANDVALSGFPRNTLTTDACRVDSTGALSYTVSTGWGMLWAPSATPNDFEAYRYRPIVLDTVYSASLASHDATHPRIDLVCIAPAWESDVPESRNVKNPATGVVSSTSIDARRRFSSTIQVVTGTPAATPSAPAVPAGYLELARATVPAVSGSAVWKDTRKVLEMGHFFKGLPVHAVDDYVPLGNGTELEVAATSPASMQLEVERGRASIGSVVRSYPPQRVTVTTAHGSLARLDLVTALDDGTLAVVAGTAHATPTLPATPAGSIALAQIEVGAAVTSITGAKITDLRAREPFDGTLRLQEASTNHDRLTVPEVYPKLFVSDSTGDQQAVDIDLFYPDTTTPYPGPFGAAGAAFEAELYLLSSPASYNGIGDIDADFAASPPGVASQKLVGEDAAVGAGAYLFWFKPAGLDADSYNFGSGPATGGKLVFWMPGASGKIKVLRRTGSGSQTVMLVVRPLLRPGASTYVVLAYT